MMSRTFSLRSITRRELLQATSGIAVSALLPTSADAHAFLPVSRQTENVIFVMTDGLRWQEVFGGADGVLLNKPNNGVQDANAFRKAYWRDTPEARRAALMPFLWSVIAKQGQIYGNRFKGSNAFVTNGKNFSYPGYNETLCGFPDPRIDSNANRPNPNTTVLEWLHKKPNFRDKVAAFGAWKVIAGIFNAGRCGFPVNVGYDPLNLVPLPATLRLLNRLKAEMPRRWENEALDAFAFHTALIYLRINKPRILYLSLGETDEWGHAGNYKEYLDAARRVDSYVSQLWRVVQATPQYRDKTTLIFSPDHGRGEGVVNWRNHSAAQPDSKYIWMAFLGPDTPALGERANIPPVTQNQIAATLAAVLGEDYNVAVPQAGSPIYDVLGTNRSAVTR